MVTGCHLSLLYLLWYNFLHKWLSWCHYLLFVRTLCLCLNFSTFRSFLLWWRSQIISTVYFIAIEPSALLKARKSTNMGNEFYIAGTSTLLIRACLEIFQIFAWAIVGGRLRSTKGGAMFGAYIKRKYGYATFIATVASFLCDVEFGLEHNQRETPRSAWTTS